MALLFFATLRLCYFGAPSLLDPTSMAAMTGLALAVAINLAIGWWRRSVVLTGLAMLTGYAAALAVGTPWYVFGMVTVLSLVAVMFWVRERSQFATFIYAMTGYGALSMALIKAAEVPQLFVWLSAQSLLVVTVCDVRANARNDTETPPFCLPLLPSHPIGPVQRKSHPLQ